MKLVWPLLFAAACTQAQVEPVTLTPAPAAPVTQPAQPAPAKPEAATPNPEQYILGPHDQLTITYSDGIEEPTPRIVLVDNAGEINLPLVGRVAVSGMTTLQAERELASRLQKFYKRVHVTVAVTDFRSQPVSVIGAVNTPGVHHLRGSKRLIEVLSAAGGLRNDAGNSVKITRRLEYGAIPLKTASREGEFSVANVSLKSIMEASSPEENIEIRPHDVVSVPRADLIYVVGEVARAGGFALTERADLSVLQALSLAGGLAPQAAPQNAKLLRPVPGGAKRTEVAVNLRKILEGKEPDVPMHPDDLLFIPGNGPKRAISKVAETAIQTLSGIAIFRAGQRY
jgi:polysaccharide export outer membrane protein